MHLNTPRFKSLLLFGRLLRQAVTTIQTNAKRLTPIILDGKLDEATIAMELGDINSTDEFCLHTEASNRVAQAQDYQKHLRTLQKRFDCVR